MTRPAIAAPLGAVKQGRARLRRWRRLVHDARFEMFYLRFCLGFSIGLFGLAACSSESSSGGAGGGPYSPPGNGVAMAESVACENVRQARIDTYINAGCGPLTLPACPDYLRQGRPACMQYDQGSAQGCVDYVKGMACEELKTVECVVKELPGTEGSGCP